MVTPSLPTDPSPSPAGAASTEELATSVEELYVRYRRPAAALARRILVDDALVEDVLQEVFLTVWRDPGAFDPDRGDLPTWLMTLVHHKAVDVVRREEAHRRRAEPAPPIAGGDVAGEACGRATDSQVRTALSALPAGQREVLALAYFGGYSQQQIAELTATPLGTVKSRTGTAVRRLRRDLRRLAPAC